MSQDKDPFIFRTFFRKFLLQPVENPASEVVLLQALFLRVIIVCGHDDEEIAFDGDRVREVGGINGRDMADVEMVAENFHGIGTNRLMVANHGMERDVIPHVLVEIM